MLEARCVRPSDLLPLAGYWRLPPGETGTIVDVTGVLVGHVSVVRDEPYVERTGVTVVVPPARFPEERLPAGVAVFNGTGELTGALQVAEWGYLETPIALTGTRGVGAAWEGIVRYLYRTSAAVGQRQAPPLPLVGECNDMFLHDTRAPGLTPEHVAEALEVAGREPGWGAVGAGVGMTAFGFKGGVGTASRRIPFGDTEYHLGALCVVNFGRPGDLVVAGCRIGHLPGELDRRLLPPARLPEGSLVAVLAVDAPLDSHALTRIARRAPLALARVGGFGRHYSGDLFLAFTTEGKVDAGSDALYTTGRRVRADRLDPFFLAAVEAVEEAILHALLAAETTVGREGRVVRRLPVEEVRRRMAASGGWRPPETEGAG